MPHPTTIIGLSDIGRARTRNEDSFALVPESGVAVVADGMGGHPGGDVASRVAADSAADQLGSRLGTATPEREDAIARLRNAMGESVMFAHHAIRERGTDDAELEGMGTTITALALDPWNNVYALGHVGDSRAYLYRDEELSQLTRDDTWVQERVEASELTPEQARRHPFSHILTQCMGLDDPPTPHILDGTSAPGDVYLLCSDGLVGMLEDEDIVRILGTCLDGGPDPEGLQSSAAALVSAANEAGGYDNITVALVLVGKS